MINHLFPRPYTEMLLYLPRMHAVSWLPLRAWVSQSTLHSYLSALPFAPATSWVSKRFLPQFPQTLSVQTSQSTGRAAITNILRGHTDPITSVAFSIDGERIVSGFGDKNIRVWSVETGNTVSGPFKGHTGWVSSVAFSPNGKGIVAGSEDQNIQVWNAETGDAIMTLTGHSGWVTSVAFSPDGERIVSGSGDETI